MSHAFVPTFIAEQENTKLYSLLTFFSGIIALAILAQIAIPLPWTPVPITGQTFGVTLISLLFGLKRGFTIVTSYVLLGFIGFPFLAAATLGATFGYLLGMVLASLLMGYLADIGWTTSFVKTWFAGFLGSCVVFACGLSVLSFFIPSETLLISGLLPFLPGDAIKTVTAAFIAYQANQK